MSSDATLNKQNSGGPSGVEPQQAYLGLSTAAWVQIGVLTFLMVWLFYAPCLRRLGEKTLPFLSTAEANWGHSVAIPLIGLYYLYLNREELLKAKSTRTAWEGLGILLGGLLLFAYGIFPGQNDFVKDFGMVVTLFGVVLFMAGWAVMRIAWFPIAFLVCGIPWPGLVYSWIAGPLQQLAAKGSVFVLRFLGVTAYNAGTKIFVGSHVLNVAEACAGLRSLMTFISVAAALAFLSSRPLWQKIVITVSAIPIAVGCNIMRVAGQGLLDRYWSPEWSQSFAHQFAGMVMLIPAFFMVLAVAWFLDQLFIEVAEDKPRAVAGGRVMAVAKVARPATVAAPARPAMTSPRAITPANIPPSRPAGVVPPPPPRRGYMPPTPRPTPPSKGNTPQEGQ
jgi:exosortase